MGTSSTVDKNTKLAGTENEATPEQTENGNFRCRDSCETAVSNHTSFKQFRTQHKSDPLRLSHHW